MQVIESRAVRQRGRPGSGRSTASAAAIVAIALFVASQAGAVGAPAGTQIQNQASATYTVGATPLSTDSPVSTVTVDELVDVTVTLQSPPVPVDPNDTDQVLSFLVTNSGNGSEVFELDPNSVIGGDDFDPVFASIYLDDGDGIFDPLTDTLYAKGTNDPTLDANDPLGDSVLVFLLNDIPGTVLDAESGLSRLTATSRDLGAQPPGTSTPNAGDGGLINAVSGVNGGQDGGDGTYVVASVSVTLDKQYVIVPHATFGTAPVPGATIRYTITVTTTGTGTATSLVVTDLIPAGTAYENNSLTLTDGAGTTSLSDAADLDAGDYNGSLPGGITVDLGDVPGGSADRVVEFSVLIDPI